MSVYYSDILTEMYAGCEWSMSNEDYSTLQWFNNTPKPTQKELDNKKETTIKAINDKQLIKDNAKKAAQEKLNALGLTIDDLVALGF